MPLIHIKNILIEGPSLPELRTLKEEIFNQEAYFFETHNPQPVIVDVGAHVGVASLYWLWHHPAAQIWAVEPHPQLLALYEENLFSNGFRPQAAIQAALAGKANAEMILHTDPEWPSSSSLKKQGWTNTQSLPEAIRVPGMTLSKLLDQVTPTIDLLKLDIEGGEQTLLTGLPDAYWHRISQLLVEFHPGDGQSLAECSRFLERKGFALEYRKNGKTLPLHLAKGLVVVAGVKQSG